MSDVNSIREKIINWLKQDGFRFSEVKDPDAHFNLMTTLGRETFNIFQSKGKRDSIIIASGLKLTSEQIGFLSKMELGEKQSFLWNLRIALLTRQVIGDFKIKPEAPVQVEEVFLSSKPIYYDGLTKTTLFSTLYELSKTATMIVWMLEETAGAPKPSVDAQLMYV